MTEPRTAAATRARHLTAVKRRAEQMASELREIGWLVLTPEEATPTPRAKNTDRPEDTGA